MLLDQETLRYIFGFKLRGLRQERHLSLKELAKKSGLSPSYINEIEKGKKYPKSEKVMTLAHCLGVSYDELISLKLKNELGAISKILEKNLLRGLPFEVFGIPGQMLFELMADRPTQFSALVGTLLEIARIHNISIEEFFSATLRSHLDMKGHYFPDLEEKVQNFKAKYDVSDSNISRFLTVANLKEVLAGEFAVEVVEEDFSAKDPDLQSTSFFLVWSPEPKFSLNEKLSEREKVFILAKEIAFKFLNLDERFESSHAIKTDSYEKLFNNFKASYFASSLIVPKDRFIAETKSFFEKKRWNKNEFLKWVQSYPGPYSSFFYRLTQVLPNFFKIDQMFFLRFGFHAQKNTFTLLRELHLSQLHAPHKVISGEHYCRRWVTTSLLKQVFENKTPLDVGIQLSSYWGSGDEYLCFSLAYPKELSLDETECVTVGLRINSKLKHLVQFLTDSDIPHRQVCETCERCGVENCQERAAEPSVLQKKQRQEKIIQAIERART